MALVSLKEVLQDAYSRHYAVGAFNVINLDFLEAIVTAAEDRRSPVILNIAEIHFPFVKLENIVPAIKAISETATVPIVLNLDHGLHFEAVVRAIKNGFTSVMFDGSQLSFIDNVKETKNVVKLCHAADISVEAELGAVGGEEGGGLEGTVDPSLFTNPELAAEFVHNTKIDALAVAIGNSHGKYKGEPKLDFKRLESIRDKTGIPLVLHGGSGISTEYFRKAIKLGISKINFFTGISQAALETISEGVKKTGLKYNDYPMLLNDVKASVTKVVSEQMDIFMSSGKV